MFKKIKEYFERKRDLKVFPEFINNYWYLGRWNYCDCEGEERIKLRSNWPVES